MALVSSMRASLSDVVKGTESDRQARLPAWVLEKLATCSQSFFQCSISNVASAAGPSKLSSALSVSLIRLLKALMHNFFECNRNKLW